MKRAMTYAVAGLTLAMAHAATAGQTTHIVSPGQSIQTAIDAASNGDIVLVEAGTYIETINFDGKRITVESESGPEVTTLDANGTGSVVTMANNETLESVLAGFTLTGGTGTIQGARTRGGAVLITDAEALIKNCIIRDNTAQDGGGVSLANGLGSQILGCVFLNNSSTGFAFGGGAIWASFNSPIVKNCTFVGNSAADGGVGYSANTLLRFINCIQWNNTGTQNPNFGPNGVQTLVTDSDVEGGWPGNGNIDADPMFVNQAGGNLRLMAGSPCIDRGDSTQVIELGLDAAYLVRGVNDPDSPDRGEPALGNVVDMGAYELQTEVEPSGCRADITGPFGTPDGQIGFPDLLEILSGWGPCP